MAVPSHPTELLGIRPLAELAAGLEQPAPIVHREGGSRASRPADALEAARSALPAIGVTRVAEITHLLEGSLPVFQSTRPSIFGHPRCGQNLGAQGKGVTREQAEISCVMESIEAFSAEPLRVEPIRASWRFLRACQVALDPRRLIAAEGVDPAREDEPLMWLPALSLEHRTAVLVPAETVLYPFFAEDYDTRSLFPPSSNGLAAGGCHLEAVVHGLCEVIERHYWGAWQRGLLVAERLESPIVGAPEGVPEVLLGAGAEQALRANPDARLFPLLLDGGDLPVVACQLRREGEEFLGFGCATGIAVAIQRAVAEAVQSSLTWASGAREDLDRSLRSEGEPPRGCSGMLAPREPTLTLGDYTGRVCDRSFAELREELDFLVTRVHRLGFPDVLVAQLTRRGVEVPVCRVVVPGMLPTLEGSVPRRRDSRRLTSARYRLEAR